MFRKNEDLGLRVAYDQALDVLIKNEDPDKYEEALSHVEKLHKMRVASQPDRVSYDTMVSVAANLIGIALIIRHEHVNVITSKALSFIPKLK